MVRLSSWWRARPVAALAGGLVTACLAACRAADSGEPRLLRLIEEEPTEAFSPARLGTGVAFDTDFRDARALAGWRPKGSAWELDGGALAVDAGEAAELERDVPIDASELHFVELTLSTRRLVRVELSWQGGRLEVDDPAAQGPRHRRTFRFDLSSHPGWRGRCERLVLRIVPPAPERIVVRGLRGLYLESAGADLEAALARPWKVELDHEVASALLLTPGRPFVRELTPPPGAVLRFALGRLGGDGAALGFRLLADGEALYETAVGPGWGSAEVDLGSRAGGPRAGAGVELTALVDGPAASLVAWAHPEIVGRPEADRPDLVLVSVDTWRADRMSLYGHDRPTTPRLDAWAAERAAVFTRAVAPAPWTLPSHTSMLTGLDALGHGVNHPSAAASYDLVTVAERLRAAGYFTAAVTGGGWLHPGYGLAQGFDRYRYWPARGRGREEWAAQAAALAGELRSFRRPYFLFVHTYAVHDYRALPPDREDGDPEALRLRRYDRALTETDALLGPLLERLSGGETAVVVTSDHGEGLLAGEEPGHGSLYEHTLRVPLLISVPDRRGAGTTVASLARTVDVVPTLLELSGLAVPPGMDGRSLLPRLGGERPDRPPVAVSYMALDSGLALRFVDWKYTFDNSALARTHGREALYRLDTDPGETIDLAPGNPRAERYRSLARRWLRERLAGLGLRLVNTSAESFRGRLVGTQVDPQSVKAAELPCHCLEEDGEGAVSFEVPRGGSLDLLLEAVSEPKLRIEADRGGGQRLALAVDLDELRLPVRFRFTGDGWREAAPGELDRGVELRWHRMRGMGETAPYERDEALRRQLEALGYLGTKRDSAVKALGSE